MSSTPQTPPELPSRAALRTARRVVVKAGTSVVTNNDGEVSLVRLGAITEQISELVRNGTQVIFVSSGAVGMGKRLLRKQGQLHMSFKEMNHAQGSGKLKSNADIDHLLLNRSLNNSVHRNNSMLTTLQPSESFLNIIDPESQAKEAKRQYDSACAAAGQFGLINFYSSLFDQRDIAASQILVTQSDFTDAFRLKNLTYAVDRLLSLGIVPIFNENDAVSANTGYTSADVFSDNDSLAALCARSFNAEVLLLLTDVDGVFDRPPSEKGAKLISFYEVDDSVTIGEKSTQGRGGMGAKIEAARNAVKPGSTVRACVVAPGHDLNSVRSVLGPQYDPSLGPSKGTLFATPGSELYKQGASEVQQQKKNKSSDTSVREEASMIAKAARREARKLQALSYTERQHILHSIADALLQHQEDILEANAQDLEAAKRDNLDPHMMGRLKLSTEKLNTLSTGIRMIAAQTNPLGVVKTKRELADGLILSQITVPIGVLMIIFESRPDSLPQISALALASGNGLLLKGGKEATHSNSMLHKVIGDAIEKASDLKISREVISLITSRGEVADMLNLDDDIDLIIPRGGNKLVSYIKANTKIPVLGHADGVCHVYVSGTGSADSASKLVVDAKTDYPTACNAMETLLLHRDTLSNGVAMSTLMSLRAAGVKCLGGPNAMKCGLCDNPAIALKFEYSNLTCMVEVVDSVEQAVEWIHNYGSGHTEAIICADDDPEGEYFLQNVDAACVFKNASTRFADGYRFGLGAEVGISTGRIHARGPVGVEGLLTTKWQLRSQGVDCVAEFGGNSPKKSYTHKDLM